MRAGEERRDESARESHALERERAQLESEEKDEAAAAAACASARSELVSEIASLERAATRAADATHAPLEATKLDEKAISALELKLAEAKGEVARQRKEIAQLEKRREMSDAEVTTHATPPPAPPTPLPPYPYLP